MVTAALFLALIPPIFLGDWRGWIYRACAFLVISCPCALVISVPLAFFGGIGAASRAGVLVKGSNFLELMADVDTVVSDKTGTLTKGNFRVTEVIPAEGISAGELLSKAALAEGMSTHPIARSIMQALAEAGGAGAPDLGRVSGTENIPGLGLASTVDGHRVAVGSAELMRREGVATFEEAAGGAATVCYVAEDGRFLGTLLIRDEVKPEAASAIAAMKREGVKSTVMLTGDRKGVGDAVALELGVDRVHSGLLPQDKVTKVESMLAELGGEGRRLVFVGDGINDAPVLTRADVGIAMGSMGSDAAIEAADIVIMDDDLRRIPAVMRIAKKTVRISKQNIVFALAVKTAVLILTAFGLSNMWTAVFADVGVAVLCILNSMRLLAVRKTV